MATVHVAAITGQKELMLVSWFKMEDPDPLNKGYQTGGVLRTEQV